MPEFVKPFPGLVPGRMMTTAELARAVRLNIAAELEATHLYLAHADATDNEAAKKVLIDIANEERVHAGEFYRLLNILAPDEEQFFQQGRAEVDSLLAGSPKPGEAAAPAPAPVAPAHDEPVPTVGSLRKSGSQAPMERSNA